MRRFRIFVSSLIIVSVPAMLCNCLDPIPAGLATTIRGQLQDSVKQKNIHGAKVILRGCGISLLGRENCDIIDSVRTDKQGRFNMHFITAGDAYRYEVSADDYELMAYGSSEEITADRVNFFLLYARELNVIKIRVQIENDLAYQIVVRTFSGGPAQILKTTRDTTIYGRVLPMSENQIIFTTYDTAINASRRSIDIINVDLRDTTLFTKTITDPTKWEIGM